jgi:hypothetical protein
MRQKKNPPTFPSGGLGGILAVTYSHLAYGQTTIGAERFHFRVRNGIGWFPPAMTARKTVARAADRSGAVLSEMWRNTDVSHSRSLRLLGCYMVKPHGQLVLVS